MFAVYLRDEADVATLIDGLLEAAQCAEERGQGMVAKRYVGLADCVGDALDALPHSTGEKARVQRIRAERRAAHGVAS
jgi:hypothetical protein